MNVIKFPSEVIIFKRECSTLKVLANAGYSERGLEYIPATKVVPESFKLNFYSNKDLRVEIIFYPLPNNRSFFLCYVKRGENNGVINLKDWLKKHKKLNGDDQFKLAKYSGNIEQQMEAFSNFLEKVFTDGLMLEILTDQRWEDLPFDWAGIR